MCTYKIQLDEAHNEISRLKQSAHDDYQQIIRLCYQLNAINNLVKGYKYGIIKEGDDEWSLAYENTKILKQKYSELLDKYKQLVKSNAELTERCIELQEDYDRIITINDP